MPDVWGFNHLGPHHHCIDCGWPGPAQHVSEKDRKRHHADHEREHKREAERTRRANLAKARKTKRVIRRESGGA